MKQLGLLVWLWGAWLMAQAQHPLSAWPAEWIQEADRVRHWPNLSRTERDVFLLANLARQHPAEFVGSHLSRFAADTNSPSWQAVAQAMRQMEPLPALEPESGLFKSARRLAFELAQPQPNPFVVQQPYYERIHQQFPGALTMGESQHSGSLQAEEIIVGLLTSPSEGLEAPGGNILSPQVDRLGLAILPHPKQCGVAILDFAKAPEAPPADTRLAPEPGSAYYQDCPPGSKVKLPKVKKRRR